MTSLVTKIVIVGQAMTTMEGKYMGEDGFSTTLSDAKKFTSLPAALNYMKKFGRGRAWTTMNLYLS
jgi:hypothetical protein